MKKIIIPIILIITGTAFVIGSMFFLLDKSTTSEPLGLGAQIANVLILLLGAGVGIKGWLDLQKGGGDKKSKEHRTQELIDSPRSQQTMKGKGGIQKQKATNSEDSTQNME